MTDKLKAKLLRAVVLNTSEATLFSHLTLKQYRRYLLNCNQENIVATGIYVDGIPCGLALAINVMNKESETEKPWYFASFFIREKDRRRGIGRELWQSFANELVSRGCQTLIFQPIIKKDKGEGLCDFFEKIADAQCNKISEIYRFDSEHVIKSPFAKGAVAGVFTVQKPFRFVNKVQLEECFCEEIKENKGGWYPDFVSPLIGSESFNRECTVFAIDEIKGQLAGWLTAVEVNGGADLLYRAFFVRDEYRDTQIGFYLFTEAIKNHLKYHEDKGGLSSISIDNERALRFSRLFFKGAYNYISYEYQICIAL